MTDYTHVLYHGNCPDGFGAAFFAWLKLGDSTQYIPVNYGQDPPELPAEAEVLIVDFSYPREILLNLKDKVKSLYVLDHHKTAQEALQGLDFVEFDMERSGAMLSFNHFYPVIQSTNVIHVHMRDLASYLQDRDLWQWKLEKSKEINAAIWSFSKTFRAWKFCILNPGMGPLLEQGEAILRYKNTGVQVQADRAFIGVLAGHRVPIVNTTSEFSEVGEELCIRNPDLPFAAYYFDRADGKRQWGLRSRNGFDVSEIAKLFGGGGHKAAAGFTTEKNFYGD
jgi:oligoribonuclease NrnB/cAMP/cGMP phosphodiesterase (DHH superfamily)